MPFGRANAQTVNNDRTERRTAWLDYWETVRNAEIQDARTAFDIKSSQDPHQDPPKSVIDALIDGTKSDDENLRVAATTALSRIGGAGALKRINELRKDKDQRVRCRALVGLGLLNQEKLLLDADVSLEPDNLACIAGIALLPKPSDAALNKLRDWARQIERPEVTRMAVWALRIQGKPVDRAIILDVLRQTKYPPIAVEAINTLGAIGNPDDLPALTEIASFGPLARQLPIFLAIANFSSIGQGNADAYLPVTEIERLRGAAAIAMGQIKPRPQSANGGIDQDRVHASAVLRNLAYERQLTHANSGRFYPGAATIAITHFGEVTTDLNILNMQWLDPKKDPRPGPEPVDIVQRYFVPIGLGEYLGRGRARPDQEKTGRISDPVIGSDVILSALERHMMMPPQTALKAGESMSVRLTCILGLGLSHDPEAAKILLRYAKRLDPTNDWRLSSEIVLALALLNDPNTLDAAAACVGPSDGTVDAKRILASSLDVEEQYAFNLDVSVLSRMDHWIALRTICQGLGIAGDHRAGPLLCAIWGHDHWSSIDAARAMGACNYFDASSSFVSLINQKDQPRVAVLAALSLGELFDPDHPSRLDALADGNSYAAEVEELPDPWMKLRFKYPRAEREFHALGDSFLYHRLLPTHYLE